MKQLINWGVVVILIIGFVIFFIGLYYLEQPDLEEFLFDIKVLLIGFGLLLALYAGTKFAAKIKEINKLKDEIKELRHQK